MRKTGRILLHRGTGLLSQFIRWRTWADTAHVSLLYPPRTEDPKTHWAIESQYGFGVREVAHVSLCAMRVMKLKPGIGCDWQAVYRAAQSQLGKRYDTRGALKFITRTSASDNDRWFCSELVSWAMAQGGVYLFGKDFPHTKVAPGDFESCPILVDDSSFTP